MSSASARYPYQNEPIWSKSEKARARRLFDAALKRELQAVMQETKQMASEIKNPEDVWELERYLTQRRKVIDRRYDFRSSRLTRVLGMLLRERRISDEELHGLPEDRVKAIHSCAKLLSENAA
jgi:hypothetical protein